MADSLTTSAADVLELVKAVGGPGAVVALGWWLRGRFSDMTLQHKEALAQHEKEDERRHRQNLVRFAKLNTKLGIEDLHEGNGIDEYHDDD